MSILFFYRGLQTRVYIVITSATSAAGDALFLDADVKSSLAAVLRHVLQHPDQLDLTADVPGLASFGDL